MARTLAELGLGEVCRITALHPDAKRAQRLMDLGFIGGAQVEAALRSPFGDPTAYLVADTLIALRRSAAETITIA